VSTASIDRRLAAANPYAADRLDALELSDGEAALRDATLAQPRTHVTRVGLVRAHLTRRVALVRVVAAAGVVAVVLGVAVLPGRDGSERAWAAPALQVANAVPRLLVGADGWQVTRADQFSVDDGEMTFSDGARSVDLSWSTTMQHVDKVLVSLAGSGTTRLGGVGVLGTRATVVRYGGPQPDYAAVWRMDGYGLELRGGLDEQDFDAVLRSLKLVGVDDWLGAMPASVVKPADAGRAVDAMLSDMTLPPGFDAGPLRREASVRDRYQLGATVAGAVACAWIGRWADAKRAGDQAGVAAAVGALQGSKHWAILREMQAQGAYPRVLWQYVDAVRDDAPVMGGKPLTVEQSYRGALGC
jgi:hypothetical protein